LGATAGFLGKEWKMKRPRAVVLVLLIVGILALDGCTALRQVGLAQRSTTRMNRLAVGMSKEEVLSVMGEPDETAAEGRLMVLRYQLASPGAGYQACFVRLVDDKVESYGRMGDFGSSKAPALDLNITNK
jgi:hypothetical protein